MTDTLDTILAFDIYPDGSARAVTEPWPRPEPATGESWRWLHCDRSAPSFARWSVDHLPPPVRSALLLAETRPQGDLVADGLLVVLRGMNLNPGQDEEDMVAIRLWVGQRLVVSTRLRRIFALDTLRAEFEAGRGLPSPGTFLARLADLLTVPIEETAGALEDSTDEMEEVLFGAHSDHATKDEIGLAPLARSVLKIRRHMAPQRDALNRIAATETAVTTAAERYELRAAAVRTTRVVEELDGIRDRLTSLRAHIDSIHAARIGRNGYVLSIVASVFLPLGFLTGLFGVNLGGIPGSGSPEGFFYLTGALALIGGAVWALLRWRRWF
jgi:zinc transporter